MKKIVIVGGGVAGIEIASQLGRKYSKKNALSITLIDKDSVHIWKPSLHTIAAGTNDLWLQQTSFVAHAHQNSFNYLPGEVGGINRKRKHVFIKPINTPNGEMVIDGRVVEYDVLILAVGSCTNDFKTPGVSEHCYFIDNRMLAGEFNKIVRINLFKSAMTNKEMAISVVGGGATGVELVAELSQLLEYAENYRFDVKKKVKINLIESGPRLLSSFPEKISASVKSQLQKIDVSVYTDTRVAKADKSGFVLSNGTFLPSTLMVWAAGVKAPSFLSSMDGLEVSKNNMLLVRETLQSTLDDNIFAIGDCSCLIKHPLPPTAQVAHQQAKYLIKSLPDILRGCSIRPFSYRHLGGIVSLGEYNAFGSLGKFGIFPGGFIKGRVAKITYNAIYRSHQTRMHGVIKGFLLWFSEQINKLLRPPIKLD